jgi:tight adherence protein B
MMPLVAVVMSLVAIVLFCAGLWQWNYGAGQRAELIARSRLEQGDPASRRLRLWLEPRLRRTRLGQEVERRIVAAGLDVLVSEFLALTLAATLAAFLLGQVILPTVLALLSAALVLGGCVAYLGYRRRRRTEAFVAQLPELARVLANASSAGLALPSAMSLAAAELGDPAGEVLSRTIEELRLGASVEDALTSLGRRMPSREIAVLVNTLLIQQRAGGDLVRALRDMAGTLELRKDLRREVRTIMAGAVYTSYLIPILGLGSVLMINQMRAGALEEMTSTAIGRLALVIGLTLYAVGFVLVQRTTRIQT